MNSNSHHLSQSHGPHYEQSHIWQAQVTQLKFNSVNQLWAHLAFGLNPWWVKSHTKAVTNLVTKHHCSAPPKCCNSRQTALMPRWQNRIFTLIIGGITSKLHALKPQEKEIKTPTHTKITAKNPLCNLLSVRHSPRLSFHPWRWSFGLFFWRRQGNYSFTLWSYSETLSAFAVRPTKVEPSTCHLGDI